ncbi:MAG: TetR/AcrR family transcriptional regulator [Nitrospiraceae bacterium]|nr:TetR/AcrR family transcriptional regulator [Nitrospiraceae bacterium]
MKIRTDNAEKARGTREKLLEAGLRLFSEKGYLGSTTKDIALRAGVAELTLFRHFSSKEALFKEIINSYTFLPALKGLLPELQEMAYEDALALIAKKFLNRLSERRELIRIMYSEMQLYPSKVKEIYHNFIDELTRTLASYFEHLQERGVLRGFDAEYGAKAFMGLFFSYFNTQELLLKKEITGAERDKLIKQYVGIFARGTVK